MLKRKKKIMAVPDGLHHAFKIEQREKKVKTLMNISFIESLHLRISIKSYNAL